MSFKPNKTTKFHDDTTILLKVGQILPLTFYYIVAKLNTYKST